MAHTNHIFNFLPIQSALSMSDERRDKSRGILEIQQAVLDCFMSSSLCDNLPLEDDCSYALNGASR